MLYGPDAVKGAMTYYNEHKKGARPSTKNKHQVGQTRKQIDYGGEKGDSNRRPPSKRPPNWKGSWPPKGN
jgi:hypothetical protein